MIQISDLTPAQIRMLDELDDGLNHEQSIGLASVSLAPHENQTVELLMQLDLVEITPSRKLQAWIRLTEKGRKVSDERRGREDKTVQIEP